MIKMNVTDPVHLAIGSTAAFTAFQATGGVINSRSVIAAISAFTAGTATNQIDPNKANTSADSHVVTPYASNIDDKAV